MELKVIKYKKSVLKIFIVSIFLFVLFFIVAAIVLALNGTNFSSGMTGMIALLLVIDIMLLSSSVCGALFLTKNKNIKDIEHFKAKKALDFGLFYFRVSLKIDKTIENLSKMNKFKKENINQ